jgi:hypothetical protein
MIFFCDSGNKRWNNALNLSEKGDSAKAVYDECEKGRGSKRGEEAITNGLLQNHPKVSKKISLIPFSVKKS